VHMTLIQTALLHGLDPFHYYVAIMKAIPYWTKQQLFCKFFDLNHQILFCAIKRA